MSATLPPVSPTTGPAARPPRSSGGPRNSVGQFLRDKIRNRSKSPSVRNMDHNSPIVTTPTLNRKSSGTPGIPQSPSRIKKWLRSSSRESVGHPDSRTPSSETKTNGHYTPERAHIPNSQSGSFGNFVARISNRWKHRPVVHILPTKSKTLVTQLDPREIQSEEDLVSKSLASEVASSFHSSQQKNNAPLSNGHTNSSTSNGHAMKEVLQGYYSQESMLVDQPPKVLGESGLTGRQPSYIKISCALSAPRGYRSTTNLTAQTPRSARTIESLTTRPNFYGHLMGEKRDPHQQCHNITDVYHTHHPSAGTSIVERRLNKFQSPSSAATTSNAVSPAAADLADCADRTHVKDRISNYNQSSTNNNQSSTNNNQSSTNNNQSSIDNHQSLNQSSSPQQPTTLNGLSPTHSHSSTDSPSSPPPPLKLKLSTIIGSSSENEADSLNSSYAAGNSKRDDLSNGVTNRLPSPGGGRSRPMNRPPIPPPAVPSKSRTTLAATSPTSSAPTDTCITGPMTPPDENSSLLDDVLKATETLWSNESASPSRSSDMAHSNGHATTSNVSGEHYAECSSKTRSELEARCKQLDDIVEQPHCSEQAAGFIRLATGKARLLMRKKLGKFDELIEKNLHPTPDDPQPALLDDLTGYWDLLQIDLVDVEACFDAVDVYRSNEWAALPEDQIPKIVSQFSSVNKIPKIASQFSSANTSGDSIDSARSSTPSPSRLNITSSKPTQGAAQREASKARDAERRKKLMQAKMQARARAQGTEEGDVQIFVS